MWAREKKDASGRRGGPKESLRWLEGYERLAELASHLPGTRLVFVADREADMMPLMKRARDLETPVDWLVRAAHNRCLPDGDKLFIQTCSGEATGRIEFAMPARHGVKGRTVRQQLWARRIELPADKGGMVSVTCVVAREVDAPPGVKPIEWRLLTNRHADTAEAIVELIDWYRARWEIEILFNVLKNACRVEALQLGAIERIERALALYLVVAWRIAHLMRLGRICPDLDALLFFDPDEIRMAYLLRDKLPPAAPRLNEVLRQIACLGGFLARKGDGEPGVKTIWLGLKDVHVAVKAMRALRKFESQPTCV